MNIPKFNTINIIFLLPTKVINLNLQVACLNCINLTSTGIYSYLHAKLNLEIVIFKT